MLTFSDLFWKQKEKKNNLRNAFWKQHAYLGCDIEHDILGFASRLYSLGVGPKKLVAMHHNTAQGFWVEWAVWLLGGGIVYWDSTNNITDICEILDDKKVSHIIMEDECWYLEHEEQIEELYDVIHILCLHSSEEITPLTPASYDEEKLRYIVTTVDISDEIASIYIDGQLRETTLLHKELLDEPYHIDSNAPIHIPIKNVHKLRHITSKYIFTNPIYFYEQLSFPYTSTDVCFVDEDFLYQFLFFIQNTNAATRVGSYMLQWYVLLLQQLVHATNPSKRVHLQLLFFKKIIGSIIKDNMGDPLFVFIEDLPNIGDFYLDIRSGSPL